MMPRNSNQRIRDIAERSALYSALLGVLGCAVLRAFLAVRGQAMRQMLTRYSGRANDGYT